MIEVGRTFDRFDHRGHLYVVLSRRTPQDRVAVVNLRSHYPERPQHTESCLIVEAHEHPWLRRPSCVYFERARFVRYSLLDEALRTGAVDRHPRCAPNLLRRIQDGTLASPDVPPSIKAAIRVSLEEGA